MRFEEWIGSLISLLAFAILFFFNQKQVKPATNSKKTPPPLEDNEEDEWNKFLKAAGSEQDKKKTLTQVSASKKKKALPEYQSLKVNQRTLSPSKVDEIEMSKHRTLLRSAYVTRLNRTPSISGAWSHQTPKVRQILGKLPNLQAVVISREVLEKPRGWS